jgi:probable rRNA maturation factor
MKLDIEIDCPRWREVPTLAEAAEKAAAQVTRATGCAGDVAILLSDDATVAQLNARWRGQDRATNVLSFPAPEGMVAPPGSATPRGDVILAFETVSREAREQGKALRDHTLHLLVHGLLHLAGYDHLTDAQAQDMEELERRILASMGIADPYGEPREARPR